MSVLSTDKTQTASLDTCFFICALCHGCKYFNTSSGSILVLFPSQFVQNVHGIQITFHIVLGLFTNCKKALFVMQLDTNSRLADRVDNIRVLKDLLERTAAELEREISNLNEAKQNCEYALDQRVGMANHINVENLVSREGRRDGDIVEDVVEVELHKV